MSQIQSKQAFFDAVSALPMRRVHPVEVHGYTFYVREMSARERTQFDLSLDAKKDRHSLRKIREKLLIAAVCDGEGKPIFSSEDSEKIGQLLISVVEPLFDKAREVNGIGAKDLEDVRKNSQETPDDD